MKLTKCFFISMAVIVSFTASMGVQANEVDSALSPLKVENTEPYSAAGKDTVSDKLKGNNWVSDIITGGEKLCIHRQKLIGENATATTRFSAEIKGKVYYTVGSLTGGSVGQIITMNLLYAVVGAGSLQCDPTNKGYFPPPTSNDIFPYNEYKDYLILP